MSEAKEETRKIHLLDKKVAELIAAGEVVERPASCVKELLENAVDAGATVVTLEIKNGGISFIRVTDNGSGIERADVKTAFLRHATSKVLNENDLLSIETLGFRGEALASIAAVSKTELLTRTENELAGTQLCLEGGEEKDFSDAGCPRGSTIIVRELFYNTPARMKFLKKDSTEGNAVAAVIERIALSHPEISFRFIKDGHEELHTPGDGKLFSAIHSVLGKEFAGSLFELSYTLGHIKVGGYVTKPLAAKANRNMQFFFINGRLVKSRTMMAAVEEAYKSVIMVGKFPGCVITMSINPSLCDVNVHPSKLEVRFSDEKAVFESVYYAVKNAVTKNDKRPEFYEDGKKLPINEALKEPVQFDGISKTAAESKVPFCPSPYSRSVKPSFNFSERDTEKAEEQIKIILKTTPLVPENEKVDSVASSVSALYKPVSGGRICDIEKDEPLKEENKVNNSEQGFQNETDDKIESSPIKSSIDEEETVNVVGQCFGTYILAQKGESLFVIDKHAAHERILYEKLKERCSQTSQMLLEPVTVRLPAEEYSAVLSNLPLLEQAGIVAEDFGNLTVLVRSAPLDLAGADVSAVVEETAGLLIAHKKDITPAKLDWVYHSVACRAAVKAHDRTLLPEMESLAKRILLNDDILYCPHGRPVAFEITKSSLEKKFGR